MRKTWMSKIAAAGVLAMTAFAVAQPAPSPSNPAGTADHDPAATPDVSVDAILDTLQNRGKTLKEFVADVSSTDNDTIMGNSTVRTGKVWYQLKTDGDARLRVLFEKKAIGDHPPRDSRKEYLLYDGWLLDRDYPGKIETKYQVARPGEKVNLFQLGKGPFPLPIGQDKKDVHNSFEVSKIAAATDDPANTDHLLLKPKPENDLARKFSQIDIWVDRGSQMPVRITTLDAEKSKELQTDLTNLKINPTPGVQDSDFALPEIGPGWNRHEEPFEK